MRISDSNVKSKVFFSVLFVVGFFFSASFMPYAARDFSAANISAIPDLLLALSIVCGIVYENRKAVSVIALVAGALTDIFITPPIHLSPILFFLAAYFASKTASVFVNVNAATVAVSAIPFCLFRAVTGSIYIMSENSGLKLGTALKTTILPEFALNIVTVFFVYIVVKYLYKWFKRRFYI